MNRLLLGLLICGCGESMLQMSSPGTVPGTPTAPVTATPAPAPPRPVLDFEQGGARVSIVNHLASQHTSFDVTISGYVNRERQPVTVSFTEVRPAASPKARTWYDFWLCDDLISGPTVKLLETGQAPGCENQQRIGTVRTHDDSGAFVQIFQIDSIVRYDGSYVEYLNLETGPNEWKPLDIGAYIPFHFAKAAHLRLECLRKAGDGTTQVRVAMKNPSSNAGATRRFDVQMRGHARQNEPDAVQFQNWALIDREENGRVWYQTNDDARCHVLIQGYLVSGLMLTNGLERGIDAKLENVAGSGVESFEMSEPLAADGWYSLALCGSVRRLVASPAPANCVELGTVRASGGQLHLFRQVGQRVRLHAGIEVRNDTHSGGAWVDLELGSFVPPRARWAQLRAECQRNDAPGVAEIAFGARSGAGVVRVKRYSHRTNNHEAAQGGLIVPLDGSRVWYRTEVGTSCNIVLEGYGFAALNVATRSGTSVDVRLESYRAAGGGFVSLATTVSGQPAADGWNSLWLCDGAKVELTAGLDAPASCAGGELLSLARSRSGALLPFRQLDRRVMYEGEYSVLDNVITSGGGDFKRLDVRGHVPVAARGVFFRGECERKAGEVAGLVQLNLSTLDGAAANVIGNRARYLFHGKSFSRPGNKDSSEAEMLTLMHPSEGGHVWYSTGGGISVCNVAITGFYL